MAEREHAVDDEEANEILLSIRKLVTQESGQPPEKLAAVERPAPVKPAAAPNLSAERPEPPISAGPFPRTSEREAYVDPPAVPPGSHLIEEDEEIVPLVDEDELRAVVVEIVQQELRGELGERITKNIRALVRKEVARVLEQGLD